MIDENLPSSSNQIDEQQQQNKKKVVYDLVPVQSPRAYGFLLKSTTFLCEVSPFKNVFLPQLYKLNNLHTLSQEKIESAVTPLPMVNKLKSEPNLKFSTLSSIEFLTDSNQIKIYYEESKFKKLGKNSIVEYYNAFLENKTTPLDVAKEFLNCQKESDKTSPPLCAFIKINEEFTLEQAKQSSDRWESGQQLSIIDGVPISIKDELDIKGYYTTCGTSFLSKCTEIKDKDSYVVSKLKQAGAIIVGKNNMHEIGISTLGYNLHYGFTRNPFNLNHYPGGSSSGSSSSVAAGLNPLSIGADGGGSIRIPAGLCGVVGLKPTFGRVSHTGVFDLCYSVGHIGPIGASVLDVAIGYAITAGKDDHDLTSTIQPEPILPDFSKIPKEQPLSKLRVGVYYEWINDCSDDIKDRVHKTIRVLEEQGATIVPIEIGNLLKTRYAQGLIILSEMRNSMNRYLNEYRHEFHMDSRVSLSIIDVVNSSDYIQCNRIRTMAIDQLKAIFETCDIILTPTTGITAPVIENCVLNSGESNLPLVGRLMNYAFLGNITGVPGISIPVDLDSNGLPIGIQLMGRWWEESLLLYTSFVLEQQFKFDKIPTGYYKSPLNTVLNINNNVSSL